MLSVHLTSLRELMLLALKPSTLKTVGAMLAASLALGLAATKLPLKRIMTTARAADAQPNMPAETVAEEIYAPRTPGEAVVTVLPGFMPTWAGRTISVHSKFLTTRHPADAARLFLAGPLAWFRTARIIRAVIQDGNRPVTVGDARRLQAEEGLSDADFFAKHGFVLLKHRSAMSASDWEESAQTVEQFSDADVERANRTYMHGDTPASRVWAKEAAALLQAVVPGATQMALPAQGIRRKTTFGRFSGKGAVCFVHNDLPLDFARAVVKAQRLTPSIKDQKAALEQGDEFSSFMVVNLWRPIAPATQPCRSLPLCLCDASTVRPADFVDYEVVGQVGITTMKHSEQQRWWFYPDMMPDEVLLFRQFHYVKGEASPRMPTFHTAFNDQAAPAKPEPRTSFEYRVGMLCV